jgi:hypothetical protein
MWTEARSKGLISGFNAEGRAAHMSAQAAACSDFLDFG